MNKKQEEYIRKVVQETVSRLVARMDLSQHINQLDNVTLEHVSDEELLRQYNRPFCPSKAGFGSLLMEDANGKYILNAEKTCSFDEVKSELKKKYGFDDWQFEFKKQENDISVIILFPSSTKILNNLERDMEQLGWFRSFEHGMLKKRVKGQYLIYYKLQFDPIYQNKENEMVRRWGTLYHISPEINFNSIKQNGFIPQTKNRFYSYPERIYFLTPNISDNDIECLAWQLLRSQGNEQENATFVNYKIDVSKVPDDVDFFLDPNYKFGVFTYDKIPYSAVVETSTFSV